MSSTRTAVSGGVLRPQFAHRVDLALMQGERMRHDLSHRYVEKLIQDNVFAACQNPGEFKTKLIDSLIFLTSETGRHDVRTRSIPKERVHIQMAEGENGHELPNIPPALRKIAALAMAENRAFLLRNTDDRQIFYTGNTPTENQVIYQALTDGFGLDPIDAGSTTCPGLLVLPLVKATGSMVGVAVVTGPRPDFIRPHVDLSGIRKLGLHAAEAFGSFSPIQPMLEPDQGAYAGGHYDARGRARSEIRRSLSDIFGPERQTMLAMDNRTLIRALKIALIANFNNPEMVAIQRKGEEGHFKKLVEAAGAATPKVSARVLYIPEVAGQQVIFALGGPIQHSAQTRSFDLGLEDLKAKTRHQAVAVITLGRQEAALGSIALAWNKPRPLDPFVHLIFLAQMGGDLTRVFINHPLFVANYLL